jgi:hypothetical protein
MVVAVKKRGILLMQKIAFEYRRRNKSKDGWIL